MLRGYRCIVIAAVGWLTLTGQHPNQTADPKQTQAQESIADSLSNIAATNDELIERAKRPPERQPCGPEEYASNDDLCAQWKAADAAADAAWWTVVGSAISATSLIGVFIALALARQSNTIARESTQRQLRAYLYPERVELVITNESARVACQFEVIFKNAGQTPAKLTFKFMTAFCKSPKTIPTMLGEHGSDWRKLQREATNVGQTIGPSGVSIIPFLASVRIDDFDHSGPRNGSLYGAHKTIIKFVVEWRYEDFLEREWIERAVFQSKNIKWDGAGTYTCQLNQIESVELARFTGPQKDEGDSYHRLKHQPLTIGERDRLRARKLLPWWKRIFYDLRLNRRRAR